MQQDPSAPNGVGVTSASSSLSPSSPLPTLDREGEKRSAHLGSNDARSHLLPSASFLPSSRVPPLPLPPPPPLPSEEEHQRRTHSFTNQEPSQHPLQNGEVEVEEDRAEVKMRRYVEEEEEEPASLSTTSMGALQRSAILAESSASPELSRAVEEGDSRRGRRRSSVETSLSVGRKRLRLEEAAMQAEDARLATLKAEAESDLDSPSTSRQSTPSAHSSTAAEQGYGGAKRRGGDDRPTLPRNIDRVYFGDYDIKTWYYSPYPLEDDHVSSSLSTSSANGNGRTTFSSKQRGRHSGTAAQKVNPSPGGFHRESPQHHATQPPPSDPSLNKPKIPALWICEGCLKYMRTHAGWYAHKKDCLRTHPPGRKVYQRGAHTIWEVDGAQEKLYAQNLSLLGKLFIDHKTIFFDVEPFLFYVVTDNIVNFDHVLGFFSKEKVSYDDYNLACIITFPPFQKKGFGTLMIELSYYLSAKAAIVGTPERPLSELGFKGYASFWSAVVLRALALAFNEEDVTVTSKLLATSAGSPSKNTTSIASAAGGSSPKVSKAQERAVIHTRSILLGLTREPRPDLIGTDLLHAKEGDLTEEEKIELRKARRANLGFGKDLPPVLANKFLAAFGSPPKKVSGMRGGVDQEDGEKVPGAVETSKEISAPTPALRSGPDRAARHSTPPASSSSSSSKAIGSSLDHPALRLDTTSQTPGEAKPFALCTTIERIAQATNLRVEDTAFALSELGLLKMRLDRVPKGVVVVHRGVGGEEKLGEGGMEARSVSPSFFSGGNGVAQSKTVAGGTGGTSSLNGSSKETVEGPIILISQERVREAILRRNIKRPVLDTSYVFV